MLRLVWMAMAIAGPESASASDDWLPVRETNLAIAAGSPLDFSPFLPNLPINGSGARLIAGEGGRMARAEAPAEPLRLHCASLAWSPASGGFPDHATADIYARQLAMRGYNLARLHFVDASLMMGRDRDFDFDPETLDRIHYLMAALKKEGIYWMIDGLTSWSGGYGDIEHRWDPTPGLKLEMHYDEQAFSHWRRLVTSLLAGVNPYTGVAPIRDEALALLILANEGGMEFETVVHGRNGKPHYPEGLRKPLNEWLQRRYSSDAELQQAWGDLQPSESLQSSTIRLPADRYNDTARMRDLQAYFVSAEQALLEKMTEVVHRLGYDGLVSSYNNWTTNQTALTRSRLQAVTMNTYHDWVSGYQSGAKITGESSIGDGAAYLRMAAAARWLGKPFVMSEYDHLFWNPYRYEAGLAVPSYAALQGWDALCRHGHGPIALRYGEPFAHKRAMLPYAIALDPVARAGETLAALLFRRQDVSRARNTIPFLVEGVSDLTGDMQAAEPDGLTFLALVSSIGLQKSEGLRTPYTIGQPRSDGQAENLLRSMKDAGLLASTNRTDPSIGVFESDTRELLFDVAKKTLQVVTPRTEAAAFSSVTAPISLGSLRIIGAEGGGLLAASVTDGAPSLAQSRRILIIYATDARNTGMRFRDAGNRVIDDFGKLPVLIRKGSVSLSLPQRSGSWRLLPVGLDGTVHQPVLQRAGPVDFTLSNDTPFGPTTFFLLELD
ncbi:glycoside hydrolase [Pseudorhizobium banfieldiae]|uniref:glycoside hydrolase n=1 Tax=Pseudorhizobium banfieldiae TaxID=1125847 RepID=UPI003CC7A228